MELNELQPFRIGEMVRVGDKEDGGYVIPNYFRDSRLTLISIGLGDNWSFENQGKGIFFDNFISVDHTVSIFSILSRLLKRVISKKISLSTTYYFLKLLINYLNTFIFERNTHVRKKLVSASTKESKDEITLDECLSMTDGTKILLKIDIEGDEYEIIEDVCRYSDIIELLIIEFHQTEIMQLEFSNAISVLKKSFHLAHIHGNNFDYVSANGIPNVIECTFVNRKIFMGEYEKIRNLPIPKIDYPCNPSKVDINLSF
jgi:hypothetical protein